MRLSLYLHAFQPWLHQIMHNNLVEVSPLAFPVLTALVCNKFSDVSPMFQPYQTVSINFWYPATAFNLNCLVLNVARYSCKLMKTVCHRWWYLWIQCSHRFSRTIARRYRFEQYYRVLRNIAWNISNKVKECWSLFSSSFFIFFFPWTSRFPLFYFGTPSGKIEIVRWFR